MFSVAVAALPYDLVDLADLREREHRDRSGSTLPSTTIRGLERYLAQEVFAVLQRPAKLTTPLPTTT